MHSSQTAFIGVPYEYIQIHTYICLYIYINTHKYIYIYRYNTYLYTYLYTHIFIDTFFIHLSKEVEVKLPTIWTDEKQKFKKIVRSSEKRN